ncbi:hypothetical protein CMQ_181 [Grosmannia clavigera kw1407]|uniref:Secreted protein n=1 Tax=Grosmannia clavigera (strain kw1407 / UAMH 11150) TaxID=655863 RepID=F0XQU9_GROCL|nr:uncharacterized protein CMQ_181 [Grosmannia clavigera kw1407]EFW99863.1 hypothetical protein CMQ_181 [Grosmannia clavigera kw1407]
MKVGLLFGLLLSAATAQRDQQLLVDEIDAAAQQLQINYYNDHSCTQYAGSVGVGWAGEFGTGTTNCYDYHYGTSVNIASCSFGNTCTCFWYYKAGCSGDYSSLHASGRGAENCIKNSNAYHSFRCFYYNKPPNRAG